MMVTHLTKVGQNFGQMNAIEHTKVIGLIDCQYEENVAKALRRLKSACKSSDSRFIALLKSNKGKIHSFSSFNQKHQSRYECSI